MGRGRKGITNQSIKELVPSRHHNIAKVLGRPDKSDETKINLQEDALKLINEKHESTTSCLFSFVKRRLARQNIRHQCFWKLI